MMIVGYFGQAELSELEFMAQFVRGSFYLLGLLLTGCFDPQRIRVYQALIIASDT